MAQLGGQPVPKKDLSPLSDDLDSQTPLRITEFKRDILGRLIHTLARNNDKVQETAYQYDLDGNLLWYSEYTAWGRLKVETKVTDSASALPPAKPVLRP